MAFTLFPPSVKFCKKSFVSSNNFELEMEIIAKVLVGLKKIQNDKDWTKNERKTSFL